MPSPCPTSSMSISKDGFFGSMIIMIATAKNINSHFFTIFEYFTVFVFSADFFNSAAHSPFVVFSDSIVLVFLGSVFPVLFVILLKCAAPSLFLCVALKRSFCQKSDGKCDNATNSVKTNRYTTHCHSFGFPATILAYGSFPAVPHKTS